MHGAELFSCFQGCTHGFKMLEPTAYPGLLRWRISWNTGGSIWTGLGINIQIQANVAEFVPRKQPVWRSHHGQGSSWEIASTDNSNIFRFWDQSCIDGWYPVTTYLCVCVSIPSWPQYPVIFSSLGHQSSDPPLAPPVLPLNFLLHHQWRPETLDMGEFCGITKAYNI